MLIVKLSGRDTEAYTVGRRCLSLFAAVSQSVGLSVGAGEPPGGLLEPAPVSMLL